jgi:hypothetical protein
MYYFLNQNQVIKTKIFDVVFNNKIKSFEIEAFRGAIAKLVGYEHVSFHNHISESKVAYSYPLVQYKIKNGLASFSFIAHGVEDARTFFLKNNWEIVISGRKIKLEIDTFQLRNGLFDTGTNEINYKIIQWMPLNQENFKRYLKLNTIEEKINMLEGILIGNILSMGKSLEWHITDKIQLKIVEVFDEKKVTFKKNSVITFDLLIQSNVILPNNIGLGKGVSHGFGVIKKTRN